MGVGGWKKKKVGRKSRSKKEKNTAKERKTPWSVIKQNNFRLYMRISGTLLQVWEPENNGTIPSKLKKRGTFGLKFNTQVNNQMWEINWEHNLSSITTHALFLKILVMKVF